jgi:aminoglycoside phosphotransferase (APT) family kinase protein
MGDALSSRFPGVVVAGVSLVWQDDGTNRRARFGVRYAAGDGPASVFVKASDPEHAELNAATGGLFNEARLFQSDIRLPVEHPDVYLAAIDEPNLDFVLVMEDVVARGCDPRDATRPLTPQQAANGVRALARLHASQWGHRLRTCEPLAWVQPFTATYRLARGIDWGKERVGDVLPQEVRELPGSELDPIWHRFAESVLTGPQTLLHGDPHVGNTYLCGDDVGFLDWQVAHRGHPALDLAYFVQGALTVEDRRTTEQDLVGAYLDAVDLPAAERPTVDDLWLRYRAASAYGTAIWLATAASEWQRADVSAALAHRYATAFVDLDADAAVDALEA